jgi:serine O-acetyltransferase
MAEAQAGAGTRTPPLSKLLREDLRRHGNNWARPGFLALAVHRLGAWLTLRRLGGGPTGVVWTALFMLVELVRVVLIRNVYGIEIHYGTHIGRRLLLTHQHGITIHHFASIGDDCVIHQNVTIGRGTRARRGAAHIGNRVEISPGVVILGPVRIGDGALIGPNAIVMTDVPAGAHVVSAPARILQLGGGAAKKTQVTDKERA